MATLRRLVSYMIVEGVVLDRIMTLFVAASVLLLNVCLVGYPVQTDCLIVRLNSVC